MVTKKELLIQYRSDLKEMQAATMEAAKRNDVAVLNLLEVRMARVLKLLRGLGVSV